MIPRIGVGQNPKINKEIPHPSTFNQCICVYIYIYRYQHGFLCRSDRIAQRQTTLWVGWCPGLHQHLPAFGLWTDGFDRYLSRGQQLIIGITIKAVNEFIIQRL